MESGVRREHRKESIDQIAASLILQGYLDSLQHAKAREQQSEPVSQGEYNGSEEQESGNEQ
jgi:hypothetical protein